MSTIYVHGLGRLTWLRDVPDGVSTLEVKDRLWPQPVEAAQWAMYLADGAGNKTLPLDGGEPHPLDELAPFPAAPNSTVNIRVERVVEPAPAPAPGPAAAGGGAPADGGVGSGVGSAPRPAESDLVVPLPLLRLQEAVEEEGMLRLPAGVTWGDTGSSLLFIRDAYRDLFPQLVGRRRALLLGTPGCGKTMFGLYFTWRCVQLLRDGSSTFARVVYSPQQGAASYLFQRAADGSVTVLALTPDLAIGVLSHEDVFHIIDGSEPKVAASATLLITSPREARWKAWGKQVGVLHHFLPPFSFGELQTCRDAIHPDISQDVLEERFDKWGGAARSIFVEDQSLLDRQLDAAVQSLDLQRALSAVDTHAEGVDAARPHMLFHTFLQDPVADVSLRYMRPQTDFASPYLQDVVLSAVERLKQKEVVLQLAFLDGSPQHSTLRGHMFEGVMHRCLRAGGTVRLQQLQRGSAGRATLDVELPARAPVFFSRGSLLERARRGDGLLVPSARNWPTWDAATQDDGVLTLWQATLSLPQEHGMRNGGLISVDPIVQDGTVTLVRFVWFVPVSRMADALPASIPAGSPPWAASMQQFIVAFQSRSEAEEAADGGAAGGGAAVGGRGAMRFKRSREEEFTFGVLGCAPMAAVLVIDSVTRGT